MHRATGWLDDTQFINGGAIHVYLNKSSAWEGRPNDLEEISNSQGDIVTPVICRKEDFVAAGTFAGCAVACFTEVEYPQNILEILYEEVVEPQWLP